MKRALLLAVAAVIAAACASVAVGSRGAVSAPLCPKHAPPTVSLDVGTKTFVRSGAGVVRLCRYYGVNWADSQGLWRTSVVRDGKTIAGLTRSFNALHEPPRGIFCPRDDGSEMLVLFGYAGHGPERVTVALRGCRFATNGRSTRSVTASLRSRLLDLVKR